MPLYLLRRLPAEVGSDRPEAWRQWQTTDHLVEADGSRIRAIVSSLPLSSAARQPAVSNLPVILRTSLGDDHFGDEVDFPQLAWMPRARERFAAAAAALGNHAGEFWFWPGATGVLSDVPSTASFFRSREGGNMRMFLDPASMLTPDMLRKAEDHLARIFAGLSGMAAAVLLANVEPIGGVEGVQLSPLTRGVFSPRVMLDLWSQHADPNTPVVILDDDVPAQRAVLGM